MTRFFSLLFASLPLLLTAQLVEISSLAEVESYLQDEDLLILDIDNTLVRPAQTLGSDQWFYHRIGDFRELGEPPQEALEKALTEWEAIQNLTHVLPTEPNTSGWVAAWQNRSGATIGLTTRGMSLARLTLDQLDRLAIDLNKSAPRHDELYWQSQGRGVLVRGGVVFTAATHKGHALREVLRLFQLHPRRILFVNDKASHIKELWETVEEMNIPFIGLRYGGLDGWVASFNPEVARIQREAFGRLLSDEEAYEQASRPPSMHLLAQ